MVGRRRACPTLRVRARGFARKMGYTCRRRRVGSAFREEWVGKFNPSNATFRGRLLLQNAWASPTMRAVSDVERCAVIEDQLFAVGRALRAVRCHIGTGAPYGAFWIAVCASCGAACCRLVSRDGEFGFAIPGIDHTINGDFKSLGRVVSSFGDLSADAEDQLSAIFREPVHLGGKVSLRSG